MKVLIPVCEGAGEENQSTGHCECGKRRIDLSKLLRVWLQWFVKE